MPTAENALLKYEAGQTSYAMSALTDSGDLTTFTSSATVWSRVTNYAPVIRPNGILTGGVVTPAVAAGTDDVDVAALTCNLNGVVTSVSAATDVAITRPATAVSKVNSITVNSSGSVVVVAGSDGSTTAFSETRGAAGGPPYIPTTSIEIAQVRVTSNSAAVITSAQILQTAGTHRELANYPSYSVNYVSGSITFDNALPASHTGDVAKAVHASYADAVFANVSLASDYQPPGNTHTVNSTQWYGRTTASTSTSLGAGSFTAALDDGVTDGLVAIKDEIAWFKFYPDRYQSAYRLDQGKLGMTINYPADNDITAACTISAEQEGTAYGA